MSKSMNDHFEKVVSNRDTLDRVQNCRDNNAELNDWEDEFLNSFAKQLIEGRDPSDRQIEALERIEYAVEWGREAYWQEFGDRP